MPRLFFINLLGLSELFQHWGAAFRFLQDTLDSPVDKEGSWTVSDIVEPAIMAVLQDPHEEESAQPAGERARG